MRNCLCIFLFLLFSLAIMETTVFAYGEGGSDETRDGSDPMVLSGSSNSDTKEPPSGFTPVTQEGADSEITTSSETDPGKEEEVAELVEEVNTLEETAQEEEVDGDGTDPAEETTSENEEETAQEGDAEGDSSDSDEGSTSENGEEAAEEGDAEGDSGDSDGDTTSENEEEAAQGDTEDGTNDSDENKPDGNTSAEDQEDDKTAVETAVDDIDSQGSSQEGATDGQANPGQGLIGSQGTLPGTRSATLDQITEPEINEDGSVSTWAIYSNDTWVRTTVNPDGTHEVSVVLDSGTVIRPGREYIHSGGSLNPALDAIITALEVTAAAGTVAGWVLTVTPAGALASGGVKTAAAVWGATTGVQAVRAGADAYGAELESGASQSEAIATGTVQAAVNAAVVTKIGKHLEPYQESIGALYGDTGKLVTEVGLKNYGNVVADKTTQEITGHSPGYKPW